MLTYDITSMLYSIHINCKYAANYCHRFYDLNKDIYYMFLGIKNKYRIDMLTLIYNDITKRKLTKMIPYFDNFKYGGLYFDIYDDFILQPDTVGLIKFYV